MIELNSCFFSGEILDIVFEEAEKRIEIKLQITASRKNKNNVTVREKHVVKLEAWDSAAVVLSKESKVGSCIIVESYAKSHGYFRIKQFSIV